MPNASQIIHRLVSAAAVKLGLEAHSIACIAIGDNVSAEAILARGWREGCVFAFNESGVEPTASVARPVAEENVTRSLLRRLAFFSDPEVLPYLAAPVILLDLWNANKAAGAAFVYSAVSIDQPFTARDLLEQGSEAVLLRYDDKPPAVLALARNARNERLLAHWVDLLDHFSRDPEQNEPFDASLPGKMVEYLCDRIGSIRAPLAPAEPSEEKSKADLLIRDAVRTFLPEFPELLEDPAANALRCLNAPSRNVAQDPGNLITCLVHFIWTTRSDLQTAFELVTAEGRKGFVDWLFSRAPVELELPDEFLNPIRIERETPTERPSPSAVRQPDPIPEGTPGVNLIGYPRAEMGMGELMRQSASGFATTEVPFCLVDFNFGLIASQQDARFENLVRAGNPFAVNVFHINADQLLVAREQLGPAFFRNRYNVGYWAWELSSFPDEWLEAIDLVDEIWAPSRFVRDAIAKKTTKPVLRMPLAVELAEPAGRDRAKFGLPEDAFLFLFTFDFSSFAVRKNFRGCIEAFQKAFPEGEKAGLVIKTIRHPHHQREFWDLLRAIGDDRRIALIDRVLRRPELHELIAACDAFVSLHRSEGFGLGIAEAMYLGKPVIATNYSGNVDFTRPDNSCLVDYRLIPVQEGEYLLPEGQVWADPDLDQAAIYMRRLASDREYARQLGTAAAAFIRREHNAKTTGKRYARRLKQIAEAKALLASSNG